MIDYAFKTINKVVFYVGEENFRSQKAVEKIGGVKISGLLYPDIVKNEYGTLTYLITKNEWKK